jgi:hypothetical protein
MVQSELQGVEFWIINTDSQAGTSDHLGLVRFATKSCWRRKGHALPWIQEQPSFKGTAHCSRSVRSPLIKQSLQLSASFAGTCKLPHAQHKPDPDRRKADSGVGGWRQPADRNGACDLSVFLCIGPFVCLSVSRPLPTPVSLLEDKRVQLGFRRPISSIAWLHTS